MPRPCSGLCCRRSPARPYLSGSRPLPLTPELAAIALALADPDAPVWLDGPLAGAPEVAAYLRFHTGDRIVSADPRIGFVAHRDGVLLWRLDES